MLFRSEADDLDEDTVMMDALDAGADDMQADGEVFEVYTDPDSFASVTESLEAKGYTFLEAGVQMVPQNYIKLTDEADIKNMEKLIDFRRRTMTYRTSTITGIRIEKLFYNFQPFCE